MANRNFSNVNPSNAKSGGPGAKNDDGRENGEKYNSVSKSSADFKKVVYPNESVPSLGSVDGAEG